MLLFNIDILRNNENLRLVIRKIEDFDQTFQKQKKTINIYLNSESVNPIMGKLLQKSSSTENQIFVFINKNDKLISLDFSKNYKINSYRELDALNVANKIDYSIELNEKT